MTPYYLIKNSKCDEVQCNGAKRWGAYMKNSRWEKGPKGLPRSKNRQLKDRNSL